MGRERQGWGQLPGLHKHIQDTFQPPTPTSGNMTARAEADRRHEAQGRREAERGREGDKKKETQRELERMCAEQGER